MKIHFSFKLWLTTLFCLLSPPLSIAQEGESQKEETKNYWISKVHIDQAVIYNQPSFDSPITTYLSKDKSILVFANPVRGPSGLGLFYRIKYEPKKYGYMVDTDIKSSSQKSRNNIFRDSSDFIPKEDQEGAFSPIYLTRYIGLLYGSQLFSETINEKVQSIKTSFVGLKLSGPGLLGVPTELNVLYSPPPSYYKKEFVSASGFLIMGDLSLILPLWQKKHFLLYYGAGVTALFTNFSVIIKTDETIGKKFQSQEVRIGAVLPMGIALRFKKVIFKLEGKFIIEEQRYFAWQTSLQWAY